MSGISVRDFFLSCYPQHKALRRKIGLAVLQDFRENPHLYEPAPTLRGHVANALKAVTEFAVELKDVVKGGEPPKGMN